MKRQSLLLSLALLFCSCVCRAQGENNIWAFGIGAGIDFNSGAPLPLITRMQTNEGCATVCDRKGNLLFYSNGNRVWNRLHQEMPNSTDLVGNRTLSSTQGIMIVPSLTDSNQYYLFVSDDFETLEETKHCRLRYSLIDMRADGGLGDVLADRKNIVIDDNVSEKLAVIWGSNCFFWLLTHETGTAVFKAYRVDASGVSSHPVRSSESPLPMDRIKNISYARGEMKVSSDGSRIALVNRDPEDVELYDFDSHTGRVSNPRMLCTQTHRRIGLQMYGVSFSPDDSKLYTMITRRQDSSTYVNELHQFDLSLLPDMEAVRNSNVALTASGGSYPFYTAGMRLGPDKKLYINTGNNVSIARVNAPDEKGNQAGLEHLYFTRPDSVVLGLGFGNAVLNRDRPPQTEDSNQMVCAGGSMLLTAPWDHAQYLWDDGSTGRQRKIAGSGTYWVRATNKCGTRTDHFAAKVRSCNSCVAFPTAFSPNSDGRNDLFRPLSECPVHQYQLMIYNRWGQRVFNTFDIRKGWDGTQGGLPAEIGTYYYDCSIQMQETGSEYYKGEVTLIR